MANASELIEFLNSHPPAATFKPYVELHREADALNVYFKPDADYSKRLTDHVTLFLSLDDHQIVGCRIKGLAEILEDLPNFVRVNHEGIELSIIFWSFRGGVEDEPTRRAFIELAKAAGRMTLDPAI